MDARELWQEAAPELHINITHMREWRLRKWLSVQFIRLAAWIMQMGVTVTDDRPICPRCNETMQPFVSEGVLITSGWLCGCKPEDDA